MAIFDTHSHYNLEPLFSEQESWQTHWKNAQNRGVTHSVVVGTSPETSQIAIDIAAVEDNLYASVGIHPTEWHWSTTPEKLTADVAEIARLTTQNKVVAIGEIGLDYYRIDKEDPTFSLFQKIQQEALKLQLEIALKHQLPVILHVRDKDIPEQPTSNNAYWDTITILEQHWSNAVPCILHCVSGPLAYVQRALELGAYIGVAGNVTYPSADHIRNLIKATPPERLLLETDAPYLAPVPHRGKVCEPHMIADTQVFLEQNSKIDPTLLYKNSLSLFLSKY